MPKLTQEKSRSERRRSTRLLQRRMKFHRSKPKRYICCGEITRKRGVGGILWGAVCQYLQGGKRRSGWVTATRGTKKPRVMMVKSRQGGKPRRMPKCRSEELKATTTG